MRSCLLACFLLLCPLQAADWRKVVVPGQRSNGERASVAAAGGFAWYRTWVKVDPSFFIRHERNLYEESVGIHLRDLSGAHEVWVNGTRLGTGGTFPPEYRSGRASFHRHKVPIGTLRKGEWNEIALRVYHQPTPEPHGFLGDAPFIMNYFMECVLAGPWEFLAGADYSPGPARPDRPSETSFETFRESNRVLGRAVQVTGARLSPAESAARIAAAPGLRAELLLHEPQVAQPFHFSFDERGRLWVTHSRQYPYPAGVTMVSRDKYYRSHYDKTPPAPPHHDRGTDVISIHESSRGDGTFDRHRVFADGLNLANAALRGHGGVWVMHTPHLLFYPDADGDDVADGPPETRLTGFGLEDTHSIANGLVWGPDGWLYGAQGSTTSSRVTRPGLDQPDAPGVHFEGCMVWRYHPRTRAYEIFAEGGGNTFGLEFDAYGRLYSGHNGGGTRGWHFVQGGFYLMQGVDPGKFGPPRNPYAFGDLPMMATKDSVVRFTHFGAFAEGTALPAPWAGRLFALAPLHNTVLTSERVPRGATFTTTDRGAALTSNDPAFRPVYIANAPDGSLVVADMYDFYVAHGQHYQNQIDTSTGRIYRLRAENAPLERDVNLASKSTAELVALLSHPNKWHRHTAVRLLGERCDPAAAPLLRTLLGTDSALGALNTLWALHQSAGLNESDALTGLRHPQAAVRAWTARLLGDDWGRHRNLGAGRHSSADRPLLPVPVFETLLAQAAAEPDAETLAQFASTARRLDPPQALPLAAALLARREMAQDPFIPLLVWWVFEAHLPDSAEQVLDFFRKPRLWDEPMAREHVLPRFARRLAVNGRRSELAQLNRLFARAPSPRHIAPLLQGLEEAYRGRAMNDLPEELVERLRGQGQVPLALRLRQGEAAAIAEAIALLANPKTRPEEQLRLTRALGETRAAAAAPALLNVATQGRTDALRTAALSALTSFSDDDLGAKISAALPSMRGSVRETAITALASRPSWSRYLLGALESGALAAGAIPADASDRLRMSRDSGIASRAARLLPPQSPSGDYQTRIDAVAAAIQAAAGNPYAGEATFTARCASCHRLFFKGGNIGPDLTAYQRDNLGTMLLSIINPDAEIREGYQYQVVETTDGRSLGGFIIERDNQVTVLRGLGGENITLRAAEIREIQPMGRSLMPAGLLDGLGDQELRDFFAYLRISQPITR